MIQAGAVRNDALRDAQIEIPRGNLEQARPTNLVTLRALVWHVQAAIVEIADHCLIRHSPGHGNEFAIRIVDGPAVGVEGSHSQAQECSQLAAGHTALKTDASELLVIGQLAAQHSEVND